MFLLEVPLHACCIRDFQNLTTFTTLGLRAEQDSFCQIKQDSRILENNSWCQARFKIFLVLILAIQPLRGYPGSWSFMSPYILTQLKGICKKSYSLIKIFTEFLLCICCFPLEHQHCVVLFNFTGFLLTIADTLVFPSGFRVHKYTPFQYLKA